jgi:Hypoxia induced protein conserved region
MTIMTVLVIVALLATVAALVSGIVSMAHGGGFDQRHSHQIMFARVGLQGITLVALLIAFWLAAR